MDRLLRFTIYGWLIGTLTSAMFFVRFVHERENRVHMVRRILCEQMETLSNILNNKVLMQDAERIAYEKR